MLTVIEPHPVQYHAPVYRMLQEQYNIPVTVIYGSDFSIAGYHDREFGTSFAWDTNLLSGYQSFFLSRATPGVSISSEEVSTKGLGKALQDIKTKAILLVGYSPRFYQVAIYQALRSRNPILFRGETTDHALTRGRAKSLIRDLTLRAFYQECTKLLYVGQRSKQHFIRLGCPERKLVFSPYCVDTVSFEFDEIGRNHHRQKTRQELGIIDSQIILLFSGKLSYRKGPDILLHAIKNLPSNIRERIVVLFLGSGHLTNELKILGSSQPPVKVLFLGFQNQTHLSQYYHAADLLVLPSRYSETWGLVVNESLHHGLPCVVSKGVGSASDLIKLGITGEVFETRITQSLVSSIERAFTLINRLDVREACRNIVDDYTVERAAEGIARAYEEALNT